MNTERWSELVTVLACGSLTAAANEMGYTLSAISRNMALLEKEQGYPLLYRSKSGVQPTEACQELLPYVRELLFAERRLQQASAAIQGGEKGTIRIGTAYRRYYGWISDMTSAFRAMHPGVQFEILNGTSTEFAQQLQQHLLDLCLMSWREESGTWYPLCQDSLVALIPKEHPLAKRSEIPLEAFCTEPYIATCPGLDIDSARFFQKCGIVPNTQFTTMDIQATYSMVGANLGISVNNRINQLSGQEMVCHIPLERTQRVEVGMACASELPPAAERFLEFILPQLPREMPE